MNKIFGIGITGLVGSRMVELLGSNYSFHNLSIETGVDITNPDTLAVIESDKEHDTVILLAAKADVDGCEEDKPMGREGTAWRINVDGVSNVLKACRNGKKKIIYISTDFVFSGEDTPDSGYNEENIPHPINWYAQTKFEAENLVRDAEIPYCILRLAYPYRTPFSAKKDFVQTILDRLSQNAPIVGVTDHIMTPTLVDDFALCIEAVLRNNSLGIFHSVGSTSLTPFDAIEQIGRVFDLPTDQVGKTTRDEFFKGKAKRPFNLTMNNDRIEQLGVRMSTFEEGLQILKRQMTIPKVTV